MSSLVFDMQQLYASTFGNRPIQFGIEQAKEEAGLFNVNGQNPLGKTYSTPKGHKLKDEYLGKDIWLPITFKNVPGLGDLFLPWCTIKISSKKTIVKTSLAERGGTVKELYSIDDYSASIKGFLIDPNRVWPEEDLYNLKTLWEANSSVDIDNILCDVFFQDSRVVVESLDFPEVVGSKHVVAFEMSLISDSVFILEVDV